MVDLVSKVTIPVLREDSGIDMDPQNWFQKFTIPDAFKDATVIFRDAVASLKVIGFAVALAATAIYFIGLYIAKDPQRRSEYKSRVLNLYILIMVLFGGLGIADLLYDIAVMIGT